MKNRAKFRGKLRDSGQISCGTLRAGMQMRKGTYPGLGWINKDIVVNADAGVLTHLQDYRAYQPPPDAANGPAH
ncbi:hypothetical protein COO20_16330 [Thalassospira marina]|uniref:Uncharacterized protein n=1 Tax=Thalassospira marina TaxID=2048283 RepID=A0A2N3KRT6_9PROT|nr:hypothetical protein COO20_16330 [Thalassospira marina]